MLDSSLDLFLLNGQNGRADNPGRNVWGRLRLGGANNDVELGVVMEDGLVPIHVLEVAVECLVAFADELDVCAELGSPHRVQAAEGNKDIHVALGEMLTKDVGALGLGKMPVKTCEALLEASHGLLVCLLRRGVNSLAGRAINVVESPGIELVDLAAQMLRVELDVLVFIVKKIIELGRKEPQQVTRLIVDNGLCLLVPQDGHGPLALIFRVGEVVDATHMGGTRESVGLLELPALFVNNEADIADGHNVVQALELVSKDGPVSPRASARMVEMVAALDRRELGTRLAGHSIAESGLEVSMT